jgi:hypothetical protein
MKRIGLGRNNANLRQIVADTGGYIITIIQKPRIKFAMALLLTMLLLLGVIGFYAWKIRKERKSTQPKSVAVCGSRDN